jgi:hypothetical protein
MMHVNLLLNVIEHLARPGSRSGLRLYWNLRTLAK